MTTQTQTRTIEIGTIVGWKEGTETRGRVVGFIGSDLIVSVFDPESGDRTERPVARSRVWIE